MLGCPRGKRRSHDAADNKAQRCASNVRDAKVCNEGCGDRQSQEKLNGVDRAYYLARLRTLDQQVRGHHRSPAASACRIEETAYKSERPDIFRLLELRRVKQPANQQPDPDTCKV